MTSKTLLFLCFFMFFCQLLKTDQTYCQASDRTVANCSSDDQDPVCGWFDSQSVNCLTYPCASDYVNKCLACKDVRILYTVAGKCPTSS